MPTSGPHRWAKPSEERIRPIIVERATMERRSPTGIARERETSADNAAPCQRQARTAGQSPVKNAYDRSSSSARQWSAGLRPASRGNAKPAPITLRHANVRPTPLGKAQRRTHATDHRRARDNGAPVSDRHRGPQGRETPQRTTSRRAPLRYSRFLPCPLSSFPTRPSRSPRSEAAPRRPTSRTTPSGRRRDR